MTSPTPFQATAAVGYSDLTLHLPSTSLLSKDTMFEVVSPHSRRRSGKMAPSSDCERFSRFPSESNSLDDILLLATIDCTQKKISSLDNNTLNVRLRPRVLTVSCLVSRRGLGGAAVANEVCVCASSFFHLLAFSWVQMC